MVVSLNAGMNAAVPDAPTAATVQTYDDHRMAMAFALVGLGGGDVSVADPGCVAKTFPGYWDLLDRLRAGAEPVARAV